MARRNPNYDYYDKPMANGSTQQTLVIKLYAPDGSIFYMPHGGDPARYLGKGYQIKPDQGDWESKHKQYLEEQARSLKVSNFQRTIKERETKAAADKAHLEAEEEMLRIEAEMEAQEAEIAERAKASKAKIKAKKKAK